MLRRPRSGRLEGRSGLIQPEIHFSRPLMRALGGWEALHLVGERIEMHRAVGESDFPIFVLPCAGVLQPICVIALLVVLARMRPPPFGTFACGAGEDPCLILGIAGLPSA